MTLWPLGFVHGQLLGLSTRQATATTARMSQPQTYSSQDHKVESCGSPTLANSDTLNMTFQEADSLLITQNLILMAQRYRIEVAKANELVAKVFSNPVLYLEQSVYNQQSRRLLPIQSEYQDGSQGQNIISVQQLVYLAGKRNKRLRLALEGTNLSNYAFQDLCRTLKYELHAKLLDVHAKQQYLSLYLTSIGNLRETIKLYKVQVAKGNLALKELVRLQAFLLALETEQRNLRQSLADMQADIRVLLGIPNAVWVNLKLLDKRPPTMLQDLATLQDLAQNQRPDLKLAASAVNLEEANKALEKANVVPDLNLGVVYDRNGSYIQNYTGVSAQMALPVFNQNKAMIKLADLRAKAAYQELVAARQNAAQEVNTAYQKYLLNQQMAREQDPDLMQNFEGMMAGLTRSYQQQLISVVEYIDFYESYKNTFLQYYDLENDKFQAIEELNFATGATVFQLR